LGVLARALICAGQVEEAFAAVEDLAQVHSPKEHNQWPPLVNTLAAAHAGLPDRSPPIDVEELEGLAEPGQIGFTDTLVATALMRLQQGDARSAVDLLGETVQKVPEFNPNASSALALALTAVGRPDEAVAMADTVLEADSGTYADRVVALQAKGLAFAQLQRPMESADAFAEGHALLEPTEDVVGRALMRLAEASALEVIGDERAQAVMAAADHELDSFGLGDTAWRVAFSVAGSGVDLVRP
jgi:tetratricopeptide (TPR) repeat protein